MKILAVSNLKGGVGKTTLAVHLAYAAKDKGLRVLLVDFDTQENASMMFEPADTSDSFLTSSDLFAETLSPLPIEFPLPGLGLIRADKKTLTEISELRVVEGLEFRPGTALQKFDDQFDICIIDTPPARGSLLFSALVIADQVLTPIKMGKFEMSGFADLLDDISNIKTSGLNAKLKHIGSIPVKVNTRSSNLMQFLTEFRQQYKSAVLNFHLSEREAVQVAINEGRPVWEKIKGESHRKTAQEWRSACDTIVNTVVKG